jgi:hypothetical protein
VSGDLTFPSKWGCDSKLLKSRKVNTQFFTFIFKFDEEFTCFMIVHVVIETNKFHVTVDLGFKNR